jgi:hypothetical protein
MLLSRDGARGATATSTWSGGDRRCGGRGRGGDPYRAIDTRALPSQTEAWFPDQRAWHALLVDNPARLYRFD